MFLRTAHVAIDPEVERPRLADFVPSRAILAFGGLPAVHLIADASLGYGWQMGVPALESVDEGEALVADAYDQLLRQLAPGYCLDLYIGRGRDIEPYLQMYARASAETAFAQAVCAALLQRWREAQVVGFFPEEPAINFCPRNQTLFLFLKSPPRKALLHTSARRLVSWARRGASRSIDEELQGIGAELRLRMQQIEQTAAAAHLQLRRLNGDDYLHFMGALLFPQRPGARMPGHQPLESPAEAVASMGDVPELGKQMVTEWAGRRVWHRAVSMMWQPQAVLPGMLASLVNAESDLTVYLSYQADSRLLTLAKLKAAKLFNKKMAIPLTEVETQEKDVSLSEAEARMYAGEACGRTRLMVWVRGASAEDALERATRAAGHLGAQMDAEVESAIGSSCLLRSLPMSRHPMIDQALARPPDDEQRCRRAGAAIRLLGRHRPGELDGHVPLALGHAAAGRSAGVRHQPALPGGGRLGLGQELHGA